MKREDRDDEQSLLRSPCIACDGDKHFETVLCTHLRWTGHLISTSFIVYVMGASQSKKTSGRAKPKTVVEPVKETPPSSTSKRKSSVKNDADIKRDGEGGSKEFVISFNPDMTVDIRHGSKHGSHGKRRMSRIDKLKSRKLPQNMKLHIISEEDEEHHGKHRRGSSKHSDHHMTHLEKIKRRKMPVGQRIFGEGYTLE